MKSTFPQVSPMALSHRLKSDSHVTLLDVRSPAEYRSGHIPGALLTPLDVLESTSLADLANGAGLRADNPIYLPVRHSGRAGSAGVA